MNVCAWIVIAVCCHRCRLLSFIAFVMRANLRCTKRYTRRVCSACNLPLSFCQIWKMIEKKKTHENGFVASVERCGYFRIVLFGLLTTNELRIHTQQDHENACCIENEELWTLGPIWLRWRLWRWIALVQNFVSLFELWQLYIQSMAKWLGDVSNCWCV